MGQPYDVIIIGAGISGLGAACHLQRECPQKRYVILEARAAIGGTWDLFRYPGIRSDSDLHTYGYDFKPWYGRPIATAEEILRYLHEVVAEHGLAPQIRFGQRVQQASWSTAAALWTLETNNHLGEKSYVTGRFLLMCQGYYTHQAGYRPTFPGEENFRGPIIHPQQWPAELDYAGKQMVVIGSGATAATIVPAVADQVAHVVQLQRSPSYYLPANNQAEEDDLIKELRTLEVPEAWIYAIKRRKALAGERAFLDRARQEPAVVRQELLAMTAALLPPAYPLDPHFIPQYDPWKERLCLLPDGDLLKAVASGKASIVTDQIRAFVADGILLESGQKLPADIIVCATGIELGGLGNIAFTVDDSPVHLPNHWSYKGVMLSDVPNLAWIFGYIRSSWTLRVDLIARFVCRLLRHMDAVGACQCTPRLRLEDQAMIAKPFIDPADFAPGYMRRGMGRLPKQGDREPWINCQDYYVEKESLPTARFDDGVLHFG
ncbi:MAG: NAD(P)/FAD-dependent oxidoreductase [Caldilineaceae bacterium]|nr:NAD(P)/FAD-dependent oxidoreductase [Caldilineaceae bacterium]